MVHRAYQHTALVLALLATFVLTRPAHAAAPRIIMFSGSFLARPIMLADWDENLQFMLAITDEAHITAADLAQRPYLNLTFFWATGGQVVGVDGTPLTTLCPEQGDQHGRWYPAVGAAPPIVTFDSIPGPGPLQRRISATGIEILIRHGVPIRLEPGAAASAQRVQPGAPDHARCIAAESNWTTQLWAIALIALLLVGGALVVPRRR